MSENGHTCFSGKATDKWPEKGKRIEIIWADSQGSGTEGWELFADLPGKIDELLIYSIGYYHEHSGTTVTIVHNKSEKQFIGRMTIPFRCIIEWRYISIAIVEEGGWP